jgi:hypothetical protein
MKFYHITEPPLKIYGLAVADRERRQFWRLNRQIMDRMPQYDFLGKRCVGGRIRFRTDSADFCVRMTLAQASCIERSYEVEGVDLCNIGDWEKQN